MLSRPNSQNPKSKAVQENIAWQRSESLSLPQLANSEIWAPCWHTANVYTLCHSIHYDVINGYVFALLVLCAGNSSVAGEFPSQRPVTRNFDVFFDLRLNKRLGKQSRRRWFKTPLRPLWSHCNEKWYSSVILYRHEEMGVKLLSWPSLPEQCFINTFISKTKMC